MSEPAGISTKPTSDIVEVAGRFAAAIAGNDSDSNLAEIFADTVVVWHQDADAMEVPGPVMAEMLPKEAQALARGVADSSPGEARVLVSEGAFVLTRTTTGTVDGIAYRAPACSVVTLDDGRISRIDAYSDREQDAALRMALMKEPH